MENAVVEKEILRVKTIKTQKSHNVVRVWWQGEILGSEAEVEVEVEADRFLEPKFNFAGDWIGDWPGGLIAQLSVEVFFPPNPANRGAECWCLFEGRGAKTFVRKISSRWLADEVELAVEAAVRESAGVAEDLGDLASHLATAIIEELVEAFAELFGV